MQASILDLSETELLQYGLFFEYVLIMIYRLLILLFFLPVWASAQDQIAWTPQLDTINGQLNFSRSLLHRHPLLPSRNLLYRANMLAVLEPIPSLVKRLGPYAQDSGISSTRLTGVSYYARPVRYDLELLQALKKELQDDFDSIPLQEFISFEEDLLALKQSPALKPEEAEKFFDQSAQRLIKLAPFIYAQNGQRIGLKNKVGIQSEVHKKIEEASLSLLSNLFGDFLPNHLRTHLEVVARTPKMGKLIQIYKKVESNFLSKSFAKALTPLKEEHDAVPAKLRSVSIEIVDAKVAVFRGAFGGDCSILSIPYFTLVKGVSVFWIHKDLKNSSDPSGYALVAEAKINGRSLPYILTINGSTLSAADAQATIHLVAEHYGTSDVVVPDFEINKFVVNSDPIRDSMTYENAQMVEVALPEGWGVIDKYLAARNNGFPNYYDLAAISRAKLIDVHSKPFTKVSDYRSEDFLPYQQSVDLQKSSLLGRALIANQAQLDENGFQKTATSESHLIMREMNVTEEQYVAAQIILKASWSKPFGVKDFKTLQRVFGFKLTDINKLDVITRPYVFRKLYDGERSLGTDEEWKNLAVSANHYLDVEGEALDDSPDAATYFLGAKLQLPRELVGPTFWETVLPLLKNPRTQSAASEKVCLIEDLPSDLAMYLSDHQVIKTLKSNPSYGIGTEKRAMLLNHFAAMDYQQKSSSEVPLWFSLFANLETKESFQSFQRLFKKNPTSLKRLWEILYVNYSGRSGPHSHFIPLYIAMQLDDSEEIAVGIPHWQLDQMASRALDQLARNEPMNKREIFQKVQDLNLDKNQLDKLRLKNLNNFFHLQILTQIQPVSHIAEPISCIDVFK